MEEDHERNMYFIEKRDLLETIGDIYKSIIDVANELENIKLNINHLKNILKKDLEIHKKTHNINELNLPKIKMTIKEWNEYINKDNSGKG